MSEVHVKEKKILHSPDCSCSQNCEYSLLQNVTSPTEPSEDQFSNVLEENKDKEIGNNGDENVQPLNIFEESDDEEIDVEKISTTSNEEEIDVEKISIKSNEEEIYVEQVTTNLNSDEENLQPSIFLEENDDKEINVKEITVNLIVPIGNSGEEISQVSSSTQQKAQEEKNKGVILSSSCPQQLSNEEINTDGISTNLTTPARTSEEQMLQTCSSSQQKTHEERNKVISPSCSQQICNEEINTDEISIYLSAPAGNSKEDILQTFSSSQQKTQEETNEDAISSCTTNEEIPTDGISTNLTDPARNSKEILQTSSSSQQKTQEDKNEEETIASTASQDVCGRFSPISNNTDEESVGKMPITYEHKNSYESRVETFMHWPKSMKQKPEQLAEAGLFSISIGDKTICFHCGLGLEQWEDHDDPWEQHALWNPKCPYLLMKKGAEYVEQINNSHVGAVTRSLNRNVTITPNHSNLSRNVTSLDPVTSSTSTQPSGSVYSKHPQKPTYQSKLPHQFRVLNVSNSNVPAPTTSSLHETSVAPRQSNLPESFSQFTTMGAYSSSEGFDIPPSRKNSKTSHQIALMNHPGPNSSNTPKDNEVKLEETSTLEVRNISQKLGNILEETEPSIDVNLPEPSSSNTLGDSVVKLGATAKRDVMNTSEKVQSKLGQPLRYVYMSLPAPKSLEDDKGEKRLDEVFTAQAGNTEEERPEEMFKAQARDISQEPENLSRDSRIRERSFSQSPTSKGPSCSKYVRKRFSSEGETFSVDRICKICYKNELRVVFLPCGHVVSCEVCAGRLLFCTVCGRKIEALYRAYLA